jgi:predicted transposase/invertase (TIGR01784 family)
LISDRHLDAYEGDFIRKISELSYVPHSVPSAAKLRTRGKTRRRWGQGSSRLRAYRQGTRPATPNALLDPRNNYVFKRLFAASPELLADLINAVRSDEAAVEVIEILNPRIDPEELQGKFIILDVLARDRAGHLYNIEMQVRRHDPWSARSTFYLARALSSQVSHGASYATLKPAIGIHLLDFTLFAGKPQALWRFELRDRTQPHILLGPELQLNIIEMPKADHLDALTGTIVAWVTYFEHWQEETRMNQITHPPVQQALQELSALSASDKERRLAEVRERALIEEASALEYAKMQGVEEGIEKGIEKGREEAMNAALQRLVASGMSETQARNILGIGL